MADGRDLEKKTTNHDIPATVGPTVTEFGMVKHLRLRTFSAIKISGI